MEFVKKIAAHQNFEEYADQNWKGTFEDYIKIVQESPEVTRNAFQRIYDMIEDVDSDAMTLLLIDELLAGTNSLERESASLAILRYLSKFEAGFDVVTVGHFHGAEHRRIETPRGARDFFVLGAWSHERDPVVLECAAGDIKLKELPA